MSFRNDNFKREYYPRISNSNQQLESVQYFIKVNKSQNKVLIKIIRLLNIICDLVYISYLSEIINIYSEFKKNKRICWSRRTKLHLFYSITLENMVCEIFWDIHFTENAYLIMKILHRTFLQCWLTRVGSYQKSTLNFFFCLHFSSNYNTPELGVKIPIAVSPVLWILILNLTISFHI